MRRPGAQARRRRLALPEGGVQARDLLTCLLVRIQIDQAGDLRDVDLVDGEITIGGGAADALAEGIFLRQPVEPERTTDTRAVVRNLLAGAWDEPPGNAASLVCLKGLDAGRWFPLVDGDNDIGRGKDAAVRIRDRAVSRRHACLRCEPDGYILEDLRSPNGVYIDGKRVAGVQAIAPGDILEIGHTLLRLYAPSKTPNASSSIGQSAVLTRKTQRERWIGWLQLGLGAAGAVTGGLVAWGLARWL